MRYFLFLTLLSVNLFAEFRKDEPQIYTGSFSTADVLNEKETKFAPQGWADFGITDRLTLCADWLIGLGGIPAGYLRFRLNDRKSPTTFSLEAYGVYFGKELKDDRIEGFNTIHRDGQGWLRMNITHRFSPKWRMHAYGGATRDDYQRYDPQTDDAFKSVEYRNYLYPDFGFAIEWLATDWLLVQLSEMYGNTFILVDQVIHKNLIVASTVFAPFPKTWWGFLRTLRVELDATYVKVPVAHYGKFFPIYPIVYWQWQW